MKQTVYVQSGIYIENLTFNNKNIVLLGENKETTIIDGNQSGSVVVFTGNESSNAKIENLPLKNGSASRGEV